MVMFTTNRTSHTLVACSQYIMLRLFPTDSVVRLTGPGQDWYTNAKGKYIPKGRFFWYAFVAISKQCVNAFEICQRHLPT